MNGPENGEPYGHEGSRSAGLDTGSPPGLQASHSYPAPSSTPSANPNLSNWLTVSRREENRRPFLFYPKDRNRWSLTFKITQEGEPDDEWRPILIGIVPSDRARDPFAIIDKYPTHGYFLTDYGALWAHDGTYTHVLGPLLEGETMQLYFSANPEPLLFARADVFHVPFLPLEFRHPIQRIEYIPCCLLMSEGTQVQVTVHDPPAVLEGPRLILARMWDERLHTDAVIKCGHVEYQIHRAVLSHISPVFRAMFENGMIESAGRTIEIGTFSNKTVEACLCFVYTGTLHDQDALEVLPMAHMYQIAPLVIRCYELLVQNLNERNILQTFIAMEKFRGGREVDLLFQDMTHRVMSDRGLLAPLVEGWLAAGRTLSPYQ